jgi:hypothetical protein
MLERHKYFKRDEERISVSWKEVHCLGLESLESLLLLWKLKTILPALFS